MKRLYRQLSIFLIGATMVFGLLAASARAEESTVKPVGTPHSNEVDFNYFVYLRAQAGDSNSAVIVRYSNFGVMVNVLALILTIASSPP